MIGRDARGVSKPRRARRRRGLDVRERRQRATSSSATASGSAARFDSFCPIGPRVVPRDALDPPDLRIDQRLNGETLQDSRTSRLIFDVPTPVAYAIPVDTLEPGDLILTGTPEGVGVFRAS